MSKKILKIAAPIALSILAPGIGTAIGGALGAGTGIGAGILGNGIVGAGLGALGGGGLKGALLGGVTGGLGSAIGGSGILGTAAGTPLKGALGPTQGTGILGSVTRATSGISNAIGGGASSIGGGNLLSLGSNLASNYNSSQASEKALKQQLAAQQQGLANLAPYSATGKSANSQLAQLLGLSEGSDQASVTDALRNTPGYQFQLGQGTQALDRSAAARGSLFSGAQGKALQEYGQGLADQTYNQRVNQLGQQSGQGIGVANNENALYDASGALKANNTAKQSNLMNQSLSKLLTGNSDEYVLDPETGKYIKRNQSAYGA